MTTANSRRLAWPRPLRWLLKVDASGNLPAWWQWPIPRYGNWACPGWSGAAWVSDPVATDWSVPPVDAMDMACKVHDWLYQHGWDRDLADRELVRALKDCRPATLHGKMYRLLAIVAFTAWPSVRRLWRKIS
jgi:hypothetical protein